jgi:hypothetical protein
VLIPTEYVLQKYYQYAGYPKFKKLSNTYVACCPICREGNSWGKKKRSYYLVDDNKICCHNCGWYSDPIKWIQEVSGLSFNEILNESQSFDIIPLELLVKDRTEPVKLNVIEKLPLDSINLFDDNQLKYFKGNKVITDALALVKSRRLDVAVNKPDTLWVTLKDKIHKNRIIIPFYNENNEIIFYQSRLINDKDTNLYPKYLSKINGEKSLYNVNKITPDLDYIFVFEGPIDSFFVKNGTAVAGIQENSNNTFSLIQEQQLLSFKFHKKIWVLDSQWKDQASRNKTSKLIENGETVFIWPENLGKKYKDINDFCIDVKSNSVDPKFFIENSHEGLKAKLLMSLIYR